MFPGNPMDYFFLDQHFERQYQEEERFRFIFMNFAVLTIIVACLGLFGLTAFTAEHKTKEIAIRKVLGATPVSIIGLLTGSFVKLLTIASIIAFPVSFLIVQSWIEEFAYRIEVDFLTFSVAGGLVFAVAMATIGYQGLKASAMNLIQAIKSD